MSPHRRWKLVLIAAAALALIGITGSAQARCVTVGAGGVSHTQCDVP
jgi:hypothetical protein